MPAEENIPAETDPLRLQLSPPPGDFHSSSHLFTALRPSLRGSAGFRDREHWVQALPRPLTSILALGMSRRLSHSRLLPLGKEGHRPTRSSQGCWEGQTGSLPGPQPSRWQMGTLNKVLLLVSVTVQGYSGNVLPLSLKVLWRQGPNQIPIYTSILPNRVPNTVGKQCRKKGEKGGRKEGKQISAHTD